MHAHAQLKPLNIKKLDVKNGLNDGIVNAVIQDKFNLIWVASQGALNCFDGKVVNKYYHLQGDSQSAPNGSPVTLEIDQNQKLWIGYSTGLVEYDYDHDNFTRIKAFENKFVYWLKAIGNNKLFVATNDTVVLYNYASHTVEPFIMNYDSTSAALLADNYLYGFVYFKNKIYFSSDEALLVYDLYTKKIIKLPLANCQGAINRMMIDHDENIWLSSYFTNQLLVYNPSTNHLEDRSNMLLLEGVQLAAIEMIEDNQKNKWIICDKNAIIKIDTKLNITSFEYQNQIPISLSASVNGATLCSNNNYIWFNSITGLDYFHPSSNLFELIVPAPTNVDIKFAKQLFEDSKGNIWSATPNGLCKKSGNKVLTFFDQSPNGTKLSASNTNMVLEDHNGLIWIASSKGLDQYNPYTNKIENLNLKYNLPIGAYKAILKASNGKIWMANYSNNCIYFFDSSLKRVTSIEEHPLLKKLLGKKPRCIFEDSKKRIWFGFEGDGLAVFNPSSNELKHWINKDDKYEVTIPGNNIIDIKEDTAGTIWVSSLNGLAGIRPDFSMNILNHEDGLQSNYFGPLYIDLKNRLWVGTSNSLVMIHPDRKNFTRFTQNDGLAYASFMELGASADSNGFCYFPTPKGFIKFNPDLYDPSTSSLQYFLQSYTTNDTTVKLSPIYSNAKISFDPDQNFISFNIAAPCFDQSLPLIIAYHLNECDDKWSYTSNTAITFNNLSPGKYTLQYAVDHIKSKPTSFKTIEFEIKNFYYKTLWFKLLMTLVLMTILFAFYRFRTNKLKEVAQLHERAQLLEKEKSVVQYENLVQQLNPHFLFNSLTSLSSLITIDPKTARQFVDQMSKIYRYILKSSDNETVTLKEEITFAQTYVKLQQTRFSEGFIVNIHVDDTLMHRRIVPVTLQNLIENALKHNKIERESPLVVTIYTHSDCIIVENNLQQKGAVETSNKQGLKKMQSLYRYLSNRPIAITQTNDKFEVHIPLI
ncbi:MAG: hypothetical protein RIQ89_1336 [Bacteroidota bacterium]|jgi:ligand-binding sensor domain-containing protein